MPGLVQLKSFATRKISQYAKQQKAFQVRNARSLVAIKISATLALATKISGIVLLALAQVFLAFQEA